MESLNNLLQELGISKVKLAKYLGVSRQMVYNYLTFDNIDKWPKEKKILLFQLLEIDSSNFKGFDKLNVTTEYMLAVEKKLNSNYQKEENLISNFDLSGVDKDGKALLSDIVYLLKEKWIDGSDAERSTVKYTYYLLQSMDNVPEIKYIMAYIAKTNGFIKPEEFMYNEDKQFIFEGILYSGLNLYNNGSPSKSKVAESRKRFIREIEQKNEEKMSRTQALNTIKIQALHELGYNDINEQNAAEVFEKIAEIQSRKV
ncbi:MAG: hypothetical protein PUD07_04395 [bacterium]|nr:hypothetical protein [bacterium]